MFSCLQVIDSYLSIFYLMLPQYAMYVMEPENVLTAMEPEENRAVRIKL